MLVLRSGAWALYANDKYVYTRWFFRGYRWTPFCIRELRCYENKNKWDWEVKL